MHRKLGLSNEIIIKINGGGTQNILNSNYLLKPNEIIVNGNPATINEENQVIDLPNKENIIIMKQDNKINDCFSMFENLTNIIEVDLTNFDSSEVINMNYMFFSCTNLKNIIFSNNFDSSKVLNMAYMLAYCKLLTSIDLSNFNTHSVEN